jgi:hypothetical protein
LPGLDRPSVRSGNLRQRSLIGGKTLASEKLGGRRQPEGNVGIAPAQVMDRRTQPAPAAVDSMVASNDMAQGSIEYSA